MQGGLGRLRALVVVGLWADSRPRQAEGGMLRRCAGAQAVQANGQSPFLYAPIASCYHPQGSLTHLGFLSSLCILCYVLTDTHTFVAENESNKISNLCVDADGIRSSSSGREGGMDVFILKKQGRQLLSGLTP